MPRFSRPVLPVVASVLLLVSASCGASTASPAGAPTAPATSPAGTANVSATPSTSATPASRRTPVPVPDVRPSDLVARVESLGELCCPSAMVVVTAAGEVVTRTDDGKLVERRLTAAGAQRVRDEVLGSGLFDKDQRIPLEPVPGKTPPAHGIHTVTVRAWNGTSLVAVSTSPLDPSEEAFYQPLASRARMNALLARLLAPETWLPASAWVAAAPRPYVARAFRLILSTEPVGGSQPDVDDVDWPFAAPMTAFGEPAGDRIVVPVGPGTSMRCATLVADDIRAVRSALERAGVAVYDSPDGAFSTGLGWRKAASGLVLYGQPVLPDQSSCAGSY